ncbi:putative D,D-dipeptide-binding periplasmic protein DdpA precursor [Nocardioides dokdonensis FR1436]|uniref:Putative D,D-dipeptide-binding periplasmic protein DdpA n=1 Tax=Nocardioides dokdonensis FR1436 TaxID=1300347 RepID=A0A1A9GP06_9ACTN|nr:ABC transporter substrate-binding protein [Nocardioides dokdonensis]ANH39392.1 putative D,D-dipeptide-binding periplasmic protein DdpA precursor [Nocardioides dokdonensis FR1436]
MRRTKPLAVVAGAALLTLAACGGSGSGGDTNADEREYGAASETIDKDPEAQGPAEDIEGATAGGTVTVFLPGDPGPDDLDPTNGWSVTGNSIQQALTSRSLTQYKRDPESETGEMILVPDLAVDLGQPNEDFTEWTFEIRDDATWEDGSPITAEEVAWGINRSMDSEQFPSGPGTEYSQTYFLGAGEYEGPYTDKGTDWEGVEFDNDASTVTIKMAKTFPDMDYWGAFMAMGPAPLGKESQPPAYGQNIKSNGPYKVDSFRPGDELVLVKNDQWNPDSDPARHQYADKWVFKFNADGDQTDQIMLSDNTESQTALSTQLGSSSYTDGSDKLGDRLIQQSSQCTSFLYPDYESTDLNWRKAVAYAYPYEDVWQASGEVPGVTRVPANSIMPPGMAGKSDYFVDGEQFTFDPEKAKELLAESDTPAEISMIFYEADPLQVAAQKVITEGFEQAGFKVKATGVQESPYSTWTNPDDKLNKSLNLRGVNWCSDWPSGLTMVPPLTRTGATYNTGFFSEQAMDDKMDEIPTLDLEEQAAEWGALDEAMSTEFFPIIPTAFRNDLYAFGTKIGNPSGDGSIGAPNYKDIFVMQ